MKRLLIISLLAILLISVSVYAGVTKSKEVPIEGNIANLPSEIEYKDYYIKGKYYREIKGQLSIQAKTMEELDKRTQIRLDRISKKSAPTTKPIPQEEGKLKPIQGNLNDKVINK